MKNKIFAFWESKEAIPAYLELCKQTWIKNIPNLEIHILNHSNLAEYIGDVYDLNQLKKISFPMQSDIISAAVLEKFGGLFIDLDCIVIDDIFKIFENLSEQKLIGFGYPNKGMHLAVLYSKNKNNPILREWRKTAQDRLINMPEKYDWSYFGNSILNPLLQSDEYKDFHLIIDRTTSGNILESKAMLDSTYANSKEYYVNFYFNKFFDAKVKELCDLIKFGVVSLHNSWTPVEYKKIKNIPEFLNQKIPLVDLLKYVLNNETQNSIRMEFAEPFLISRLSEIPSFYKKSHYGEKLVIDFKKKDIHIGFDIYVGHSGFNLDLVIRNSAYNKLVHNLDFKKYNFNLNKTMILRDADVNEILDRILELEEKLV